MKIKYFATLSMGLFAPMLFANNSIDGILSSIERNNIELKAVNSSILGDSANISTTNNLEDPKIDFEYNFGDIGDKWGIGISQGFDWPGLYFARKKANSAKVNALRQAYKVKEFDILYQAKIVCLNIVSINQQIEAQKLIYSNIEDLYAQYSKAYNHGEASIIDINKIKIERIAAKQVLDELYSKLASAKEELLGLNGNVPFGENIDSLTDYPEDELNPIEAILNEFATFDPQNLYYAKVDETIKNDVNVSKLGWMPKFDVGYKYTNELGDKFNGVTVGASIPLFSNRKRVAATKSLSLTNEMERQNYATLNISRIKAKYAEAVSLKSQIALYGDVLSDNNNFAILKKALDGGQISLLNYLLELRYFLDAKNKYIELDYNYHSALAELNKYHIKH